MQRRTFFTALAASAVCPTPLLAQANRSYLGSLLLEPVGNTGRLMRVRSNFGYRDSNGMDWLVPEGALVDGASIPRIFWTFVGSPWAGAYAKASVVHDWYCAVRTRRWKDTHRMFYEAMLTSGVSKAKAKTMYLAVRYAGPSWDDLTLRNSILLTDNGKKRLSAPNSTSVTMGFASEEQRQEAEDQLLATFNGLNDKIVSQDLSLDEIDALVQEEGRAETAAAMIQ